MHNCDYQCVVVSFSKRWPSSNLAKKNRMQATSKLSFNLRDSSFRFHFSMPRRRQCLLLVDPLSSLAVSIDCTIRRDVLSVPYVGKRETRFYDDDKFSAHCTHKTHPVHGSLNQNELGLNRSRWSFQNDNFKVTTLSLRRNLNTWSLFKPLRWMHVNWSHFTKHFEARVLIAIVIIM